MVPTSQSFVRMIINYESSWPGATYASAVIFIIILLRMFLSFYGMTGIHSLHSNY